MLSDENLVTLARYQTGLFTALVGLVVAKGLVTRDEVAAAIDLIARNETDEVAGILFKIMSEGLRAGPEGAANPAERKLSVIAGGRMD